MSIDQKVEELRKKYRGILSEEIIEQTAEGYRNDLNETRLDTLKEVEDLMEKLKTKIDTIQYPSERQKYRNQVIESIITHTKALTDK